MINITNKYNCCGCEACVQMCPKKCISFVEDSEGFLYPKVDKGRCIECNICERVCPVLNSPQVIEPRGGYAVKNSNEHERLNSSSGGTFLILARKILSFDGVVFGARFDDYGNVVHDYVETEDRLSLFVGSKYVQSRVGDSFIKCRYFVEKGRYVLFTGTPCQIAALKSFLRKDFEKLLTVEIICHGVPSPKVWSRYLREFVLDCDSRRRGGTVGNNKYPNANIPSGSLITDTDTNVIGISFKNKSYGWNKYSLALTFSDKTDKKIKDFVYLPKKETENPYMRAFISDWISRPSCYKCVFKGGRTSSDMTIGDYWGVEKQLPDLDDDKGVSLIVLNNFKAEKFFRNIDKSYYESFPITINNAMIDNPSYYFPVKEPLSRKTFFELFLKNELSVEEIVSVLSYVPPIKRMKQVFSALSRRIMNLFVN